MLCIGCTFFWSFLFLSCSGTDTQPFSFQKTHYMRCSDSTSPPRVHWSVSWPLQHPTAYSSAHFVNSDYTVHSFFLRPFWHHSASRAIIFFHTFPLDAYYEPLLMDQSFFSPLVSPHSDTYIQSTNNRGKCLIRYNSIPFAANMTYVYIFFQCLFSFLKSDTTHMSTVQTTTNNTQKHCLGAY